MAFRFGIVQVPGTSGEAEGFASVALLVKSAAQDGRIAIVDLGVSLYVSRYSKRKTRPMAIVAFVSGRAARTHWSAINSLVDGRIGNCQFLTLRSSQWKIIFKKNFMFKWMTLRAIIAQSWQTDGQRWTRIQLT